MLEQFPANLFLPLLMVIILDEFTRTVSLHLMQNPVSLMLI